MTTQEDSTSTIIFTDSGHDFQRYREVIAGE